MVGFVVAVALIYFCESRLGYVADPVRIDTVYTEKVTVDTAYIDSIVRVKLKLAWDTFKTKVVMIPKPFAVPGKDSIVYRDVPVLASFYRDSVDLDLATLYYNIGVVGQLYSTDFDLRAKVPTITRTIANTYTITKEVAKEPGGLFVTAGFNTGAGLAVGGMYVKKKWAYGYEYGLNKSHSVRVGRTLRHPSRGSGLKAQRDR